MRQFKDGDIVDFSDDYMRKRRGTQRLRIVGKRMWLFDHPKGGNKQPITCTDHLVHNKKASIKDFYEQVLLLKRGEGK